MRVARAHAEHVGVLGQDVFERFAEYVLSIQMVFPFSSSSLSSSLVVVVDVVDVDDDLCKTKLEEKRAKNTVLRRRLQQHLLNKQHGQQQHIQLEKCDARLELESESVYFV